MSSLHPDRLSRESAASASSGPVQRGGALPAGSSGASSGRGRKARAVTATVARAATATAARTASATVKIAASGARAAATRAGAAHAAAVARRTDREAPAAEVPATEAPAAAIPPAGAPAGAPATVTTATAAAVPAGPVVPTPPVAGEAPAVPRRPTPCPRTPQPVGAPAAGAPVVEVVPGGTAADSPGAPSGPTRRRPSLYLAAAVVTVIGVSGGLSSASPPAQAGTEAAAAPVSVAERLGISAEGTAPVVDAETTDRLGELVASRVERDAEKVQATRIQAKADRIAVEEARGAAAAAAEAARPEAVLPVTGARLTSGFGARWGTVHAGIDLAAPMRTPEYAVMDGIVLEAGPARGFGLAVYIQHENGDVTVYGHMDEILVSAGQVVEAGDTIALLGNQGQSTGPHLHFEVHQGGLDGTAIDPLPWLRERGLHI